jgi:hemerythrin-like domain-containing protein
MKVAAAVAGRLSPSPTEAVAFLKQEHERLRSLLKQGEETTARGVKARTELLGTLGKELAVHELIEEEIFYPVLKRHAEARDIVLEGYEEHHVCDLIVEALRQLPRSDERWGAKFNVLRENIEHHIEEEESDMFKTARSVLSHEQLEALGAKMAAQKERSMAAGVKGRR